MKHITLIAREDRSTGELGLIIEGTRLMDYPMVANDGLLVAHDLIEHQQGIHKIGSIGDELLALGAIWYVRGQHSDLRRGGTGSMHSPETNIAYDVINMGRMFCEGVQLRQPVPKTRAGDHEDAFQTIIQKAREEIGAELTDIESLTRRELAEHVDEYLEASLHLMRSGFRGSRAGATQPTASSGPSLRRSSLTAILSTSTSSSS